MTVFRDLSQHILDIAENGINANASCLYIDIIEDLEEDQLTIHIRDDGHGMDAELLSRIVDPWVTSRTTRNVGLGIPFLKQTAEMCGGSFTITSQPQKGTSIRAVFQHSHIDRPPLGDVVSTILCLIVGYQDVNFTHHHQVAGREFNFDTVEIHEVLGDEVPLSDPDVLSYIRQTLEDGWQTLHMNA
ncbi:MAG: ATP-binding protein [Anaerolineae bacterium]|nr:ATP-binding protein [Anaerolineae bacterium]